MDVRARSLSRRFLFITALLCSTAYAADPARFDLVGPRIDVRVTRGENTLPIASVPNLQAGDKLWLHPDLPASQSVHYLLICVFLRGTTNPPPDEWFVRIPTWDRKVREEGAFVTVPAEAEQAVLFMAPETGGDFSTLRSAVKGRPGVFVRASQDLAEAGFEQARIEKYLASIRRVPPSDPKALQEHSDLLARTLALKPNPDCFKRPVDTQFTCLTQSGSQTLLDDGHGQSIASALSNGPSSDFINQASYTRLGGAGEYSAYVGAIVDLVRLTSGLHTAQYQYIPAIAFPQGESMNLRLNTPPSFHNPKSVLVIGLPAVQAALAPPLRPADANSVTCLLQPAVTLPIEGAPLVFSTDLAHDLTLHLNTPAGAPVEADVPLVPDAFQGGLVLQRTAEHHVPLREGKPLPNPLAHPELAEKPRLDAKPEAAQPEPVLLTGTIRGRWGFDAFTGPTVSLQQLPGGRWHIVPGEEPAEIIAGHSSTLRLTATGTACVHTITARPSGSTGDLTLPFQAEARADRRAEAPATLLVTLPLEHSDPGDLHLAIQQFAQPSADAISTRAFAEPSRIDAVELHAGDRTMRLTGVRLGEIERLQVGDLSFTPVVPAGTAMTSLLLTLPSDAPLPATKLDDHLTATATLRDGRTLKAAVTVTTPRPAITLLHKAVDAGRNPVIALTSPDDLPLTAQLLFTLKSPVSFPRNGQIEIETVDGTLRTVLTLAPSGGLLLQDPRTVVATLDPLRSFGPSAFGDLRFRAVYPAASPSKDRDDKPSDPPSSDWLPLATLVRLPEFSQLQCPADTTQPCIVTGAHLFLIESVSIDPAFANPLMIPDGYTGTTFSIPHPDAATIFLHLRDDSKPIDSAILPTPQPTTSPATTHPRASSHGNTHTN